MGLLLRKRLSIVGTSLRTRDLEEKIAAAEAFEAHFRKLLADARLRPILDRVLLLEEAAEAHRLMEENSNFGKLILSISRIT